MYRICRNLLLTVSTFCPITLTASITTKNRMATFILTYAISSCLIQTITHRLSSCNKLCPLSLKISSHYSSSASYIDKHYPCHGWLQLQYCVCCKQRSHGPERWSSALCILCVFSYLCHAAMCYLVLYRSFQGVSRPCSMYYHIFFPRVPFSPNGAACSSQRRRLSPAPSAVGVMRTCLYDQ